MSIKNPLLTLALLSLSWLLATTTAQAAMQPKFILTPTTPTTLQVSSLGTRTVQYSVVNNTSITRTLTIVPLMGVIQNTLGDQACSDPFRLQPNQSCLLNLTIQGSQVPKEGLKGGPKVCKTVSPHDNSPDLLLCSHPNLENSLNIQSVDAIPLTITSTPSNTTAVGVIYTQLNIAKNGTLPYAYTLSAGTLPRGTSLNALTGTVSGIPTTAETFNYTIQVNDGGGEQHVVTSRGTISQLLLTATPSPYTEVGVAYTQTNVASDGAAPYTYGVSAGSLPIGTTLDPSTGTVSGTPTTPGAFSYTIEATDANHLTATALTNGSLHSQLVLTATPSPYTEVGTAYTQTNGATGGTGSYTYSVSAGTLPAGTSLNPSTGTVSGTLSSAGAFSYTIQVTDTGGGNATAHSSGTIATQLSITATPSLCAEVGVTYSQTNIASGGTTPYTYSVAAGTLPAGTTLNTNTGTVSGIPSTSGLFNYTIQVSDAAHANATVSNSGTMTAQLSLMATPSSITHIGAPYSQLNTASGGSGSYTYNVAAGTLPTGLSLNTNTGTVSGTPTAAGPFSYTIQVRDTGGGSATATSNGTLTNQLLLTATPPLYTEVGVSYSQLNTAAGGTAPYTYSLAAGSTLPKGLSLAPKTGTVSGTPTTAGVYSYTIQVTDATKATATALSSGTIAPQLTLTATPSLNTEVGVAYSQTNVASGGTAPYTYSLSKGNLPAGTSLNTSTGTVEGTPTTAANFNYTIQISDATHAIASANSQGTIAARLTLTATLSPYTEIGVSYSQTNTPSGGTAPYTYRVATGTLPTGTTLNTSTGTVSGTPTSTGAFNYTIQVSDADLATATASSSGTIQAQLTLTATPSLYTEVGVTYSQLNAASGGTGSYTYSLATGTLPKGLSLNTKTGIVSGTPTAAGAGAFSYTIQVVDTGGGSATASSSGAISPALVLTATPSATKQVGVPYLQTNTASGGTGTYTYALSSGALPAGTTLNTTTGTVSGSPTLSGSFHYIIQVTDTEGGLATATSNGTLKKASALSTEDDDMISPPDPDDTTSPPLTPIPTPDINGIPVALQTLPPTLKSIHFNEPLCTAQAFCITTGTYQDQAEHTYYLLAQHLPEAPTWTIIPTPGSAPPSISCASHNSTICIAAEGTLLIQTTTQGRQWDQTNRPVPGYFKDVSCTAEGELCIAVGATSNAPTATPLIIQSTDQGQTWSIAPFTEILSTGIFHGASCTQTEAQMRCVAQGEELMSATPLLAQSTDFGATWQLSTR